LAVQFDDELMIYTVEPIYQVKLLSALRSGNHTSFDRTCVLWLTECLGDPAAIHPFLVEISKDKQKFADGGVDTGAAALHLAIRCGSG
jgi:hypothetical protein